jgi:5-methylcytosine-specific restriction endonuclease McrA
VKITSGPTWRRIRAQHKAQASLDNTPCGICGTPIDWDAHPHSPAAYQLDHITPLSKGGAPYEPSNLQPVHRYCNRLKSDRPTRQKVPLNQPQGMQLY